MVSRDRRYVEAACELVTDQQALAQNRWCPIAAFLRSLEHVAVVATFKVTCGQLLTPDRAVLESLTGSVGVNDRFAPQRPNVLSRPPGGREYAPGPRSD